MALKNADSPVFVDMSRFDPAPKLEPFFVPGDLANTPYGKSLTRDAGGAGSVTYGPDGTMRIDIAHEDGDKEAVERAGGGQETATGFGGLFGLFPSVVLIILGIILVGLAAYKSLDKG